MGRYEKILMLKYLDGMNVMNGRRMIYAILPILIFSTFSNATFSSDLFGRIISSISSNESTRAIVYILPYEKCDNYWTKTYGDRIYYYVYGHLSQDKWAIEEDFEVISRVYDRVIVVIPADDTPRYFKNLMVVNSVAEEYGVEVLYAIFPKEKYGREDTYLEEGSDMYNLVVHDMRYLASMNATCKIAIWYGWSYRCNSMDIVNFYHSLPDSLKGKYAIWLDEEYAEKVRDVYLHGLPYDVLFITEAYDKGEVESYSCLYYNQMLVTGYEGAKSLQEWRENIENLLSVCRTSNVGIWIFYDIGDGSGEEYGAFIDGNLTDFNFSFNVPFQKGFSYAAWWNNTFLQKESDISLMNLANTSTKWVSLVVTWYQEDKHSLQIRPDIDRTPSDESIIHAINVIHSLGMKVMLKPHVDLYNGEWRGEIWFENEFEWQEWFNSYRNFICHYARLAEENNVEQFCVGCELVKTTSREEWFNIIQAVRNLFSGPITYAANWDNYQNAAFWQALDFIGIDAYFPLTDKNDPSINELMDGWKKWKSGIEEIYNLTRKPVIFTEIGYRSIDGCNRDPWNWQRDGKIDLQEQADCYEAAFRMFYNESWFYGFYWWMWYPDLRGGADDRSYTPYGKPAEKILKKYYSEENEELYIEIKKPETGKLYFMDREIMTFTGEKAIVIGGITVEVESNGNTVEFYVDNDLKYVDNGSPYSWKWNEPAIGNRQIKVIAYNEEQKVFDKLDVMIFNI